MECDDKEYKKIVKFFCEIATPISFKEYVLANNSFPLQYEIDRIILEYIPRQINIQISGISLLLPKSKEDLLETIESVKNCGLRQGEAVINSSKLWSQHNTEIKSALIEIHSSAKNLARPKSEQ